MGILQQAMIDLLHKTDSPSHKIMLFAVPFRSLRVIATDDTFRSFRVEQLVVTNKDPSNPRGSWNTLSTHGGPEPGAAWRVACKSAMEAQETLKHKLQERRGNGGKRLMVPA